VNPGGLLAVYSSAYLEVLALTMKVERFKFPRRYRCRNNSTINLYCNASQFGDSLKRHPRWNEKEISEVPLSLNEALRSYLELIQELKEAYLAADSDRVETVLGKLAKSGKVLGYHFEEAWIEVTKTLFVSVRSGSGRVLLDLEL